MDALVTLLVSSVMAEFATSVMVLSGIPAAAGLSAIAVSICSSVQKRVRAVRGTDALSIRTPGSRAAVSSAWENLDPGASSEESDVMIRRISGITDGRMRAGRVEGRWIAGSPVGRCAGAAHAPHVPRARRYLERASSTELTAVARGSPSGITSWRISAKAWLSSFRVASTSGLRSAVGYWM